MPKSRMRSSPLNDAACVRLALSCYVIQFIPHAIPNVSIDRAPHPLWNHFISPSVGRRREDSMTLALLLWCFPICCLTYISSDGFKILFL